MTTYNYEDVWPCTREEAIARVHDFYRTPEHDATLPLIDAPEVVRHLSSRYTLHIITSRVDEIRDLTLAWLERHFPQMFTSAQFINNYGPTSGVKRTKADVCTELSADLMIEDSLEHARSIAAIGIPVILIDCPWNQGDIPENVYRVASWRDIGELLLDQKTVI